MRVCVVYDCLFPWTVGGAERWLRSLAEELARGGHDVTYLTRRQWKPGDEPRIPGVRVVAVAPDEPLYDADGRRRTGPPLRFGRGVLGHLLRHRDRYDVVHTCSFPFFSLLAARVALAGRPTVIGVDWFEIWTREYWTEYLGRIGGRIGHLVQRLCIAASPVAFVYSRLHAQRLEEEGLRSAPHLLGGLYEGPVVPQNGAAVPLAHPVVAYAGRHIPEKRTTAIPAAVERARRDIPDLRAVVLGDGPERQRLLDEVRRLHLESVVESPGFVDAEVVRRTMREATCLLLPSRREGYGMVVIEAAAAGTPSVVVAGPDNAATELVDEGVNGHIAASAEPEDIAAAIGRVVAGGPELRQRTRDWFVRRAPELAASNSVHRVMAVYEQTTA